MQSSDNIESNRAIQVSQLHGPRSQILEGGGNFSSVEGFVGGGAGEEGLLVGEVMIFLARLGGRRGDQISQVYLVLAF